MKNREAEKLVKGDRIMYANQSYEVAELKQFPHGVMIGIYDETPTKHIDYLQPYNCELINKEYPCYACQGGGCNVCGGYGTIIM